MTRNAVSGLLSGLATVCLVLILTLCLSGCVVTADTARQMQGVARALETMPNAPVNEQTQAQISGWSAWAAYLLKTASGL